MLLLPLVSDFDRDAIVLIHPTMTCFYIHVFLIRFKHNPPLLKRKRMIQHQVSNNYLLNFLTFHWKRIFDISINHPCWRRCLNIISVSQYHLLTIQYSKWFQWLTFRRKELWDQIKGIHGQWFIIMYSVLNVFDLIINDYHASSLSCSKIVATL